MFVILLFISLCNLFQVNSAISDAYQCDQSKLANLFIGSGGPGYGDGSLNPGAQYPYGVLRLGPDTAGSIIDISFRHYSGYHYLDNQIRGFSHTRLVGAGVYDLGNIGIMPITLSKNRIDAMSQWSSKNGWWSTFNKSSEFASPGYYQVYLDEPKVQTELLAISTNAAIHKYTWDAVDDDYTSGLVIDVCHAAKLELDVGDKENRCLNATISHDGHTFTAAVLYHGKLSGYMWHYVYGEIVMSDAKLYADSWKTCVDKRDRECAKQDGEVISESGTLLSIGLFKPLSPDASKNGLSMQVRVGLSHISTDYARLNLIDALPATANDPQISSASDELFSSLKTRTELYWCKQLSSLSITPIDGDIDIQPMLYGALYHTLIALTDYTEHDGVYLGMDKTVHNATAERLASSYAVEGDYDGHFFSDFSLWDTYRTLHPWILLMNEELSVGVARSMSEISNQQQAFPRWVLGSNEGSCMIGESGSSFIVDMISSGFVSEFDVSIIATVLQKQSTQTGTANGRADVDHYMKYGYVSSDAEDIASSLTLTYAYDDYILSKILSTTNDITNSEAALSRSQNYRNIWSADNLLFCPRAGSLGNITCASDPALGPKSWAAYVEGNALHWSWFVPHDIKGLISLYPSAEFFHQTLETFFINHISYHETYGSAAPNPYYWAGNEHSSLIPWLFNYGPDCTRTQYWTRNITHMHFSNTPHGLPGNDDYGAMSSWLLFSSLGLFPQAGMNVFLIGSPRVQQATLRLKRYNHDIDTSIIEIITYDNSAENVYVAKLLVNGMEWKAGAFIDRMTLTKHARVKLEFYMQAENDSGLCTGK